jgi:hypothetical protein
VVPLRLASNILWAARCYRGCLMSHAVGGGLVWRDNLADVIGGDLVLERKKIGSANSDFVERYSGERGKTQSHASMGRADDGDIGAWRLGFWGSVMGSKPCANAEEHSETRKEREGGIKAKRMVQRLRGRDMRTPGATDK